MHLEFVFGAEASHVEHCTARIGLHLPNRLLAGAGMERWQLPDARYDGTQQNVRLWRSPGFLCGVATLAVSPKETADAVHALYRTVLAATADLNIYRIWNFIPGINCPSSELDRYMRFCMGRASAFEESARRVRMDLPAASAVGTLGGRLVIVFIAGSQPVRTVENPVQVPAYEYPSRYGPKSPSFARAAVVGARAPALYISGTASIRDSESMHVGDVGAQTRLAIENLDIVADAAQMDTPWRAGGRVLRAYVRHSEHTEVVCHLVEKHLLRFGDMFNVIQADICRTDLLVELEAFVPAG